MGYRFFGSDDFQFRVEIALGCVGYGLGDVGEVLATIENITDGSDQEWFDAFLALARRVEGIADDCAAAGHEVSARDTYLRACTYYSYANEAVQGLDDPAPLVPTFKSHRRCWDEFAARCNPPIEPVAIPYEGRTMPGYFMKVDDSGAPRPTVILTNGSDGAITAMYMVGLPAIQRGYNALIYDGPGQQSMLFLDNIPFRPDWENVVTPVVDYALTRPEVDPTKLVLYGCSQAGYWVPRALAFEHRFAAAVADPGVVDVSTSWAEHLPQPLLNLLAAGKSEEFNKYMSPGLESSPAERREWNFRSRPYGSDDPYEVFKAVQQYNVRPVVDKISTPILVCDPEDEQCWPGQPKELFDLIKGPKERVVFTAAEGANRHCEPMGRKLTDQRMFDWIATILDPELEVSARADNP